MHGTARGLVRPKTFLAWLYVAGGYMAVSLAAYAIPFPSSLTPFWPGPAVAVTALCLGGWVMLPGVVAGAAATAVATGAPLSMAAAITVTATLESILVWRVGHAIVPRWWRFASQRALVVFVVCALLASGFSALLGCLALEATGSLGGFTLANLAVWWTGDGVGLLILAPLLLSLARLHRRRLRNLRLTELALAMLSLLVLATLVFTDTPDDPVMRVVLGYMAFPLMIWDTLRFEIPGAALGMLMVTLVALTGTALGHGPFARAAALDSFLMLQAYVAVMGITSLVLAVEVGLRRKAQSRLRLSQERLNFALWGTDLGLWDWHFQTGAIYFNDQWARLLGYEPEDIKPDFEAWVGQIHPADRDRVRALLDAHLAGGLPHFEADMRIRNSSGQWQWVQTRGKVVRRDDEGRPLRAAGTHRDIDESKRQEQALAQANAELKNIQEEREQLFEKLRQRSEQFEKRAREDHLTRLPNRRHFETVLEREWERARRFKRPLCLGMVDLDHFKAINDEHSHQLGDRVLKRFSGIIAERLRQTDLIARYGGEEFVLIFPETNASEGAELCERLRRAIEGDQWSEMADGIDLTCSFGVADNSETRSPEELVSLADRRLYTAKRRGRNQVVGPEPDAEDQPVA